MRDECCKLSQQHLLRPFLCLIGFFLQVYSGTNIGRQCLTLLLQVFQLAVNAFSLVSALVVLILCEWYMRGSWFAREFNVRRYLAL